METPDLRSCGNGHHRDSSVIGQYPDMKVRYKLEALCDKPRTDTDQTHQRTHRSKAASSTCVQMKFQKAKMRHISLDQLGRMGRGGLISPRPRKLRVAHREGPPSVLAYERRTDLVGPQAGRRLIYARKIRKKASERRVLPRKRLTGRAVAIGSGKPRLCPVTRRFAVFLPPCRMSHSMSPAKSAGRYL